MNKFFCIILFLIFSCSGRIGTSIASEKIAAQTILGNGNAPAICYGGYRTPSREIAPTVSEIKEDMRILAAIEIKVIRTYNVHHKEVAKVLTAISELRKEESGFEMYVMLGAWIGCKNASTSNPPIHNEESERNAIEIAEAVRLNNEYPEIIKMIAVGNEAMVNLATGYYVTPNIILKWVNRLQDLKKQGKSAKDIWITSSDNFALWGGGGQEYDVSDLNELIRAVYCVSMHTYPMHDTHYNPVFWGGKENEQALTENEKIDAAVLRARECAITPYQSVVNYMKSVGINKSVHIAETGWPSICNELYGKNGSKAVDEYKSAQYYKMMREWTNKKGITCFYFDGFDENWKSGANLLHFENHFRLIDLQSQAKFAIWNLVDESAFIGLTRNGKSITTLMPMGNCYGRMW